MRVAYNLELSWNPFLIYFFEVTLLTLFVIFEYVFIKTFKNKSYKIKIKYVKRNFDQYLEYLYRNSFV